MEYEKCGCGKDGKYVSIVDGKNVYSCNKYGRCLTYEEQKKLIDSLSMENSALSMLLGDVCNMYMNIADDGRFAGSNLAKKVNKALGI